MPPEALLSIICEAFGCPPSIALRQDWGLVKSILDYRALIQAKEQHNRDVTKMSQAQVDLWEEMVEVTEVREKEEDA